MSGPRRRPAGWVVASLGTVLLVSGCGQKAADPAAKARPVNAIH